MTTPFDPSTWGSIEGVKIVPRDVFLSSFWHYEAGQHVTILGRNNSGKTYLAYQLIDRTATARLPALILVMKPRDATAARYARELDMPRTTHWPQPPNPFARSRRGWTLWPRHTFDPDIDDPMLRSLFRTALLDSYKHGDRIVFADEVVGLQQELNLKRELETIWMRGRSMGCGLWAASQRAANMSYHGYSAPEHLFVAYEPDKMSRDRFDEIGGIADRGLVSAVVLRLPPRHFLYLQRSTATYCIVGE